MLTIELIEEWLNDFVRGYMAALFHPKPTIPRDPVSAAVWQAGWDLGKSKPRGESCPS